MPVVRLILRTPCERFLFCFALPCFQMFPFTLASCAPTLQDRPIGTSSTVMKRVRRLYFVSPVLMLFVCCAHIYLVQREMMQIIRQCNGQHFQSPIDKQTLLGTTTHYLGVHRTDKSWVRSHYLGCVLFVLITCVSYRHSTSYRKNYRLA